MQQQSRNPQTGLNTKNGLCPWQVLKVGLNTVHLTCSHSPDSYYHKRNLVEEYLRFRQGLITWFFFYFDSGERRLNIKQRRCCLDISSEGQTDRDQMKMLLHGLLFSPLVGASETGRKYLAAHHICSSTKPAAVVLGLYSSLN